MIIRSQDHDANVTLTTLNVETEPLASFNVQAVITDGAFHAEVDGIWMETDRFAEFVARLVECERTRSGHAALNGMSPADFSLQIEMCGRGYAVLKYTLGRSVFTCTGPVQRQMTGGFDLDAEYFSQIVQDFQQLMSVGEREA